MGVDTVTIRKAIVVGNELFEHNYENGELVTILQKHGDGWICVNEDDLLQVVHEFSLFFKPDEFFECEVNENGVIDFELPTTDDKYYLEVDENGQTRIGGVTYADKEES